MKRCSRMKIFQTTFLLLTLLSFDQLFSSVFSFRANAFGKSATINETDDATGTASATNTATITTTMPSNDKDTSQTLPYENPYTLPPDSTSGNPLSKMTGGSPTDEFNSSIDQNSTVTVDQTWHTGSTDGYLNTPGDTQPRFENETLAMDDNVTNGVVNNQWTEEILTTTTEYLHSDTSHRSHRKRNFLLANILLTASLGSVVCNSFSIVVHSKKSPALASILIMLCATDIVQGVGTIAFQVLDFFLAKKFIEHIGSLGVGLKLRVALGRGLNAFLDRVSQVLSALICIDRFLVLSSTIGLESWIQVHSKVVIVATYALVFVLVVTDGYIMYAQLSNDDDRIAPLGQRTNGTIKGKMSDLSSSDDENYSTSEGPQVGSQNADVVSEVSESSVGHEITTIFEHYKTFAATTVNSIIGGSNHTELVHGERHSCNTTIAVRCKKHGSQSEFDPTAVKMDDDMTRTKNTSTILEESLKIPDLNLSYSNFTDIPMEGNTSMRAESNDSSARSKTHDAILQAIDIAINGIMLIIFVVMVTFTITTVILLKGMNKKRDKLGCGGRRKRRQSVILVTMTTVYIILALPTTTVSVVRDLKIWPEFNIEGDWRNLFVMIITIGSICDQLKNASDFFIFLLMSRGFRMSLKVSLCHGKCKSDDIYSISQP